MIGIVDYNAGNIRSVERALQALKADYVISKNPGNLKNAEKIIFPGVGDAQYAMDQLKKTGFDSFLKEYAVSGKPLLGICLGSQIIFDHSEEGDTQCLGLIPGKIKHFSELFSEKIKNTDSSKNTLKIPHMGWNSLEFTNFGNSPECFSLLAGIPQRADVYFVHSYVICPENPNSIAAFCSYGVLVPAIIQYKNICAFQFHPEKSGETGLRLLKNFLQIKKSDRENSRGEALC